MSVSQTQAAAAPRALPEGGCVRAFPSSFEGAAVVGVSVTEKAQSQSRTDWDQTGTMTV